MGLEDRLARQNVARAVEAFRLFMNDTAKLLLEAAQLDDVAFST